MPKFDMGAAWEDSMVLLKSHSALTGTVAAVFLFLPALAISWFGPVPLEPADGATVDQIMTAMRGTMRDALPYQLLSSVIAAIGGVGVLRLWLSRTSTSVGDALLFALRMIPTMIGVQLILGLGLVVSGFVLVGPGAMAGGGGGAALAVLGALLFVGVCAYVWGRLAAVSPIIADRTLYNPVTAIRDSWALTKGNGWRIFLFLFLVLVVIIIAALLFGGIVGAVFGTAEGVGRMLSGVVEAAVGTIGGLVTLAITAAVYRQLATPDGHRIFD